MNILCTQSFIRTSSQIKNNEKKYFEEQLTIHLYENSIVTDSQTFMLKDVYDVSYKPLSATYGFLYLHTNKGVFTFTVKESPRHFIEEVKQAIQ
jgi:hypothetical protein